WINRQSMMAGALLLLPDNGLETELEWGKNAATALGLKHFATWEKNQIRIWQVIGGSVSEFRVVPIENPEHPEVFRYSLESLLEALKLTAVLGSIPAPELSASYFNNLFQITLQQTLAPVIEAYRSHRSEHQHNPTEDIDFCAREANRLFLLKVLALLWFKKMPETILPEKLDRALELSLPLLPARLYQALTHRTIDTPPLLPLEAAVALHHFLLRLRQLSWNKSPERAKESLKRLLKQWYPEQDDNLPEGVNLLHPCAPPMAGTAGLILSESPSLLAATAFRQQLSAQEEGPLVFGHVLRLDNNSFSPAIIYARLLNRRAVTVLERREFTTQLRTSWPHRRFKIRTGDPLWVWEFIHLLGISHTGQELSIVLPYKVLHASGNDPTWKLLFENFRFHDIYRQKNGLCVTIIREQAPPVPISVHLENEIRELMPSTRLNCLRSQLLLALTLPQNIYQLLGHELVWPEDNEQQPPEHEGLLLYKESSLYKSLKIALKPKNVFAFESEGADGSEQQCIPLPGKRLLDQLITEKQIHSHKEVATSIDRLLSEVLACPAIATIELPKEQEPPLKKSPGSNTQSRWKENIGHDMLAFGIPNFPEQYLYFLEHPDIKQYALNPPVQIKNKVLGQFTLEDAEGHIIEGYGEELEQALVLCSRAGKTEFELPIDREQINTMLTHYQKDLNLLYDYLKNLCYSQIQNPEDARRTTNKHWKKLNLPDPSWFKD
ncbi:MAG: hypothetical protein OQK97_05695, partial [Deltaproteobacteria bacterium]|nr:hypothetical protein [Deltaproteobacteria bacterium]